MDAALDYAQTTLISLSALGALWVLLWAGDELKRWWRR